MLLKSKSYTYTLNPTITQEARRKIYDGLLRKGYSAEECYEQADESGKSLYDKMHACIHNIHLGDKSLTVNSCLKQLRNSHPPSTSLRSQLPAAPTDQVARDSLFKYITICAKDMKKRGLVMGEILNITNVNHKELNGLCSIFLKMQIWDPEDMDDLQAFMEFFTRVGVKEQFPDHFDILRGHFDLIWCQVALGVKTFFWFSLSYNSKFCFIT